MFDFMFNFGVFKLRRCIFILLAAVFFLSLSGCSRPEPPGDILIYALKSDPIFLNPVLASEIPSKTVNSVIFGSLVKYDENLEIAPDLAVSWHSDPSGKIWTFNLREGVKWHDGAEFTSKDVVFTFEKLFDPSSNTFNRGLFTVDSKPLKVSAKDRHTIEIELPKPFAPFISNLPSLGIIPEHLLKGKDINRDLFNWHPVGTGPFKFKEWQSGEKVYVVKNEDYYGSAPLLKGIMFKVIPSAESRRIALITGSADIGEVSPEDLKTLEKYSRLNIYKWDQFLYCYMGFDLSNPLFSDARLRKAINYSVDKDGIIRAVFKNNAVRALGPISPASEYYSEDLNKYDCDLAESERLLTLAGWSKGRDGIMAKDGVRLSFETLYPSGNAAFEKAAVFMQAQMKKAGIEMRLKSMEFSALIDRCYPGKFEAVIFDWAEGVDPDSYTVWHSSQRGDDGMNFMSYSNDEADRLLEKGRTTYKKNERKSIYGSFQKIVVEDSPYLFLWTPKGIAAVNERVSGLSKPGAAGLLLQAEKIYIKGDKND